MMSEPTLRVLMLGADLDAHGGVSTMQRLLVRNAPTQVHLRHVATMVEGSRVAKAGTFCRAMGTLASASLTRQADLLHFHMAVKTSVVRKILFGRLASLAQLPLILHAHGGDFDNWFKGLSDSYKRRVRSLFAAAAKVIVLSESWKRFYLAECEVDPGKVEVMANPVELPRTVPVRAAGGPVMFLYLGAINDRKGGFRAFEAFAALDETYRSRSKLHIVGNGRTEELRASVLRRGLSESVTVKDWVGPDERDQLLAASDVYVLPSSNEGMPMGMLEAMAWGLPPLTTAVGGIPEIVVDRHNGLLVDPFNLPQITEAYQRLIADGDVRRQMGHAARRTVERLDIGLYWKSLVGVYREAVASSLGSER